MTKTPPPPYTVEGYFYLFYEWLPDYPTHIATYHALERYVNEEYSVEMYGSYNHFKVAKHNYMKKRKHAKRQAKPTT